MLFFHQFSCFGRNQNKQKVSDNELFQQQEEAPKTCMFCCFGKRQRKQQTLKIEPAQNQVQILTIRSRLNEKDVTISQTPIKVPTIQQQQQQEEKEEEELKEYRNAKIQQLQDKQLSIRQQQQQKEDEEELKEEKDAKIFQSNDKESSILQQQQKEKDVILPRSPQKEQQQQQLEEKDTKISQQNDKELSIPQQQQQQQQQLEELNEEKDTKTSQLYDKELSIQQQQQSEEKDVMLSQSPQKEPSMLQQQQQQQQLEEKDAKTSQLYDKQLSIRQRQQHQEDEQEKEDVKSNIPMSGGHSKKKTKKKAQHQLPITKEKTKNFARKALHDISQDRNYQYAQTNILWENRKRFFEELERDGLKIYGVPSDGNCLYHSIAHQLQQISHQYKLFDYELVKDIIFKYMKENEDYFADFIEDRKVDQYIAKMRPNGVWGGIRELKAAAKALEMNLHVYQAYAPSFFIEYFKESKGTIRVALQNPSHCESLVKVAHQQHHAIDIKEEQPTREIESGQGFQFPKEDELEIVELKSTVRKNQFFPCLADQLERVASNKLKFQEVRNQMGQYLKNNVDACKAIFGENYKKNSQEIFSQLDSKCNEINSQVLKVASCKFEINIVVFQSGAEPVVQIYSQQNAKTVLLKFKDGCFYSLKNKSQEGCSNKMSSNTQYTDTTKNYSK